MKERIETIPGIVLIILILVISFFSAVSLGVLTEKTEGGAGVVIENGGIKKLDLEEAEAAKAAAAESAGTKSKTKADVIIDVPAGVSAESIYIADGTDTRFGKETFGNKTGLVKCTSNGRWIYVEKGVFKEATGVVSRISDGKQVYVENGYFAETTGIVTRLSDGKQVFVKDGVFEPVTGVAVRIADGRKLYMEDGITQKFTGFAPLIGADTLVYCRYGREAATNKTFTGVLDGKKYSNSVLVDAFGTQDWIRLMDEAYAGEKVQIRNGTISREKWKSLKEAMNVYKAVTTTYGFIALNTKTGLVISYNTDNVYASASTIKAPYITALCKYDAKDVQSRVSDIYRTLQFSDNLTYGALFITYGTDPIYTFAKEAQSEFVLDDFGYTSMKVKDLAKLWAPMKEYIDGEDKNVYLLHENLLVHTDKDGTSFRDYYKKGWWEQTPTLAGVYNCGGCGEDWIYAVMCNHPNMYGLPINEQEILIDALAEAVH